MQARDTSNYPVGSVLVLARADGESMRLPRADAGELFIILAIDVPVTLHS